MTTPPDPTTPVPATPPYPQQPPPAVDPQPADPANPAPATDATATSTPDEQPAAFEVGDFARLTRADDTTVLVIVTGDHGLSEATGDRYYTVAEIPTGQPIRADQLSEL